MKDWVFGIDGGGTSSRIRAECMDGTLAYSAEGKGTNLNACPLRAVEHELLQLIRAMFASGLDPSRCKAAYIGSAGVDAPSDTSRIVSALRSSFYEAAGWTCSPGQHPFFGAGNDAEAALAGALGGTEGFLLIAGTGSIAYGRSASGKHYRAGGWGHFLGDEGSAFWIAFEGIRRGIHSAEGRAARSALMREALSYFGLESPSDFIEYTYCRFDKAAIAGFAPRVAALAESGDVLAARIMDEAAYELSALAAAVYRVLRDDVADKRLALYGGLIQKNAALRSAVCARLGETLPELAVVQAAGDAQSGACRLARNLLHSI